MEPQGKASWISAVKGRIEERNTTMAAIARSSNMEPKQLQRCLNSSNPASPTPQQVIAISQALDMNPLRMLNLLDYLPIDLQVLVTDALEAVAYADQIDSLVLPSLRPVRNDGASIIASAAIRAGGWRVEIVPQRLGRGGRFGVEGAHHSDHVVFRPLAKAASRSLREQIEDIEERLRGPISAVGGVWVNSTDRLVAHIPDAARVPVLYVPRMMRPHGLRSNRVSGVPSTICVWGMPYSGSPNVGVFLAEMLGMRFVELSYLARLEVGRDAGTSHRSIEAKQTALVGLIENRWLNDSILVSTSIDIEASRQALSLIQEDSSTFHIGVLPDDPSLRQISLQMANLDGPLATTDSSRLLEKRAELTNIREEIRGRLDSLPRSALVECSIVRQPVDPQTCADDSWWYDSDFAWVAYEDAAMKVADQLVARLGLDPHELRTGPNWPSPAT